MEGVTGNPWDSPTVPGTWRWEGLWGFSVVWGTLGIPGTPLQSWGLGTVGFQWTLEIPGTPLQFMRLGDEKDSGI